MFRPKVDTLVSPSVVTQNFGNHAALIREGYILGVAFADRNIEVRQDNDQPMPRILQHCSLDSISFSGLFCTTKVTTTRVLSDRMIENKCSHRLLDI